MYSYVDSEALHVAHLMASHGYFFPIDDHCLTVKNDNTFYRFQTPYFWPSNCWEPENTDYGIKEHQYFRQCIFPFLYILYSCVSYLFLNLLFYFASCTLIHPLVRVTLNVTAVYLCKRTMQNKTRLELADYEAENLARLQKIFSRKWEFIFMQAEAQSKVDKKRDKLERKVLDSQERAFWDVHRPMVTHEIELITYRTCVVYSGNNRSALSNYILAWVREHHGVGY